tara:strand:- start:155 stop:802 length:648 start_codon:yes stop_codon:yes gene_type:complete
MIAVGLPTALQKALAVSLGLCMSLAVSPLPGLAQANLRNSFPGRRVGGGTRGECSARTLVHLVPDSSVFAPGPSGDLALVQGPTANPVSLTMTFKPKAGGASSSQTLPASSAGLTLVRQATISAPTIWESGFDCASGDAEASADPLSFIETASPPAVSLLLSTAEASDTQVQKSLQTLRQSCGATVPAAETLAQFGLADVVTAEWPQQLPVRCPS